MNKRKIKDFLKDASKIMAFVLAFFVVLEVLSLNVFTGQKCAEKSKRMADAFSFTEDNPSTIDIVCLGSSDMWSGFVPIELWEKFGYTSVVSSFSHQSVSQAQTMLKLIRKNQDIKLVVLEVDTMYDGIPVNKPKEDDNSYFPELFDALNPDIFEDEVESVFPAFTFHNMWKMGNGRSKRSKYTHGYLFNDTVVQNKKRDYMAYSDKVDKPIYPNVVALKNFAKYCKNENLQLIFVEMPSFSSWSYPRHNAIQGLADELEVEFLDLNLLYDEIGINQADCFRDRGNHLNFFAAKKATAFLGQYINKNYPNIQNHSNDSAYAQIWNNDLQKFKHHYEKSKKE